MPDRVVGDENDALDPALCDGKDLLANTTWREQIGCEPSGFGIDGSPRRECARQRGRRLRLHANHADPPLVPRGDAADQPAAADRDQQRIQIGDLVLQLQADRCLTKQSLALIEGMNGERSGLRRPGFAGGERVAVADPADYEVGAIIANTLDLRRGRYAGTKIFAGMPSFIAA